LRNNGIKLKIAELVSDFCLEYSSTGRNNNDRDPDGADAFLCLVSAICFREGLTVACRGGANKNILNEEGCIFAPKRTP
jgi:hypothetical protein